VNADRYYEHWSEGKRVLRPGVMSTVNADRYYEHWSEGKRVLTWCDKFCEHEFVGERVLTWRKDCWSSRCHSHVRWIDWNLNNDGVKDGCISDAVHGDTSDGVGTKFGVRVVNIVSVTSTASCRKQLPNIV
jgi:hypothetical protein